MVSYFRTAVSKREKGLLLYYLEIADQHDPKDVSSLRFYENDNHLDVAASYCSRMLVSRFDCDKIVQILEAVKHKHLSKEQPADQNIPAGFIRVPLLPKFPSILLEERTPKRAGSWATNKGHIFVHDRPLLWCVYMTLSELQESRGPNSRSLLLDVGANTGSFSLLPALLPGLKVAAFEPLPSALELLVANVAANGLKDSVEVNAMALSHQEQSSAPLHANENHASVGGGLSTLSSSADRITGLSLSVTPILVRVSTLDAWMAQRALEAPPVDLIKIDVEGWELFVLQGGRKLMEKDKPDPNPNSNLNSNPNPNPNLRQKANREGQANHFD